MIKPPIFAIVFAPEVVEHLHSIERKYHQLIQTAIDEPLLFTPEKETKNRKLLEQPAPFGSTWELRFGPVNRFRVFYEVDNQIHYVQVLAIGIKSERSVTYRQRGVWKMIIAPLADVKARLSAYLEESSTNGPVVITRNGRAVAVLLTPTDDEDLESLVLSRSPRFQAILNKSRQSIKSGKGLTREDFWHAVAELPGTENQVVPRKRNAA